MRKQILQTGRGNKIPIITFRQRFIRTWLQRTELREFLDDLSNRDQRMMLSVMTLVHTADSIEKLNQDTKAVIAMGEKGCVRLLL